MATVRLIEGARFFKKTGFAVYYWSSELNTDLCQLLLCPDSTNSRLVIIYGEVIFVHLYTTVDTLCNCIDTCKSSLFHEF